MARDEDRGARALATWRAKRAQPDIVRDLTAEWFPEERAFFNDPGQLSAAECGRRAGKTRGVVRDLLRDLLTTPGYRGLYLNSTRGEAERLAWWGNRADGFRPLVERMGLLESGHVKLDGSDLTISIPATDSWIYLRGADDEAELRKALGGAYHKVYWDEAQKIPPKLGPSIREVFFPALLDFGGKFRMTGTPVRNMSGLFWDVTRPEKERRLPGWTVHTWNLLANPYWGREKLIKGRWFAVWGHRDDVVSGPHEPGQLSAAVAGARWTRGMLELQKLYGGPEVAPIDSPIMQREGFGLWVREDAAFVYHVHKVPKERLLYAPARKRPDGFPDVPAALADLPWDWKEGMYSLGADIGYHPDPFALVLWGWHPHDPALYEVCSWKRTHLTSSQQSEAIAAVRAHVAIGILVADAGGPARPAVAGWSAEFVERFGVPIQEAEKAHKHMAIDVWNGDIVAGRCKLRDGGDLYDEMSQLQWATIVSGTGRMIEDPTLANHACFVAGTLVQTEAGPRAIETIKEGDRVWTRAGTRTVTDAWCTGVLDTWRLVTTAGDVTGTGDHPVWTQRGLVPLADLTPDDTVTAWESTGHRSARDTSGSSIDGTQSQNDATCACTGTPSEDVRSIAPSGSTSADRSQQDSTSTTSTVTRSTIGSATSPSSMDESIYASTPASPHEWPCLDGTSLRPGLRRPSGTDLPMGDPGIPSTPRLLQLDERSTSADASCAEVDSAPSTEPLRCARCGATLGADVTAGSTTSYGDARSAETGSCEASTRAPVTVLGRVLRAQRTGAAEPVFNLTVDGEHEYFANGLLVSNCDGALYAHRHSFQYRWRPEDIKPAVGTPEHSLREERALEEYDADDEFDPYA